MNEDMRAAGAELVEELAPDLVHSHDWLVAGAARKLARDAGVPWLVTVHATEYGRHQGWVDKHPQSHIHAVERRMVRDADHVITCSHYMRRHVADVFRIPAPKVTAIANGIDPSDLQPVADLPRLRGRYAKPDERLILLVGRLVYEKGFHLALNALPGLIERLGNVRFLIAGSGTAEAELKAQAERLGLMEHGSFVGWTGDDELYSLYRIADLCVVPSIYEPFGLVALEAMASGCPCIVADTGGLREVVPGGGRVGAALPAQATPSRSARMAEQILTDDALRDRLVAEAREHVLRFDWADVARQTADGLRATSAASARPRRSRPPPRARSARRPRAPRARRSARRRRPRSAGARAAAARTGHLDVGAGRLGVGEHGPLADRRAVADRHPRQRDDHAALADPRARADRDRPAGRLDPAARRRAGSRRRAARGRRRRRTRTPRADVHVAAGLAARRALAARSRASRRREAIAAPRGGHDRVGADRARDRTPC